MLGPSAEEIKLVVGLTPALHGNYDIGKDCHLRTKIDRSLAPVDALGAHTTSGGAAIG